MKTLKKIGAVVLGAIGVPALAQEGSNTGITAATQAMSDLADTVSDYIDTCVPYVITVLTAALVLTLLWVGWKLIRKGANKAG